MANYKLRGRDELARRIAIDIPEGALVNLGIGMPTTVANHLPTDKEILLHSENGLVGMGPAPQKGQEDYDLINAGKQPVTLQKGASIVHHADSFAIMRGGHLDISVLGAFQVSVGGDLANWHTGEEGAVPAVGGAMDLAVGARQTWVSMNLLTKDGQSKIVHSCSYPLTGVACVKRIYTDHGTFAPGGDHLKVIDLVEGLTLDEAQRLIKLPLVAAAAATTG